MAGSGEVTREKAAEELLQDLKAMEKVLSHQRDLGSPLPRARLQEVLDTVRRCWDELMGGPVAPPNGASGDASPEREFSREVRKQARALDLEMLALARSHGGRFVAYHDGRILGCGRTPDEAVSRLGGDQRELPFVVRLVGAGKEAETMGGPREE